MPTKNSVWCFLRRHSLSRMQRKLNPPWDNRSGCLVTMTSNMIVYYSCNMTVHLVCSQNSTLTGITVQVVWYIYLDISCSMGKFKTAPKVNNDENSHQVTDSPLLMLQSLAVGTVVLRMKTRNVAHVKVMVNNHRLWLWLWLERFQPVSIHFQMARTSSRHCP